MASYKKEGQANLVKNGQAWKNEQNGRTGVITAKGTRGKEWIIRIGRKTHHINEGTLLKYFSNQTL